MNLGEIRARVQDRLDEAGANQLRYTDVLVNEVINDGVGHMIARAGLDIAETTTSAASTNQYSHTVPDDVIKIHDIRRLSDTRSIDAVGVSEAELEFPRSVNHGGVEARLYRRLGMNAFIGYPSQSRRSSTSNTASREFNATVTGVIDGVNKIFSVAGGGDIAKWAVYWNGMRQTYQPLGSPVVGQYGFISATSFDLTVAPALGDTVIVDTMPTTDNNFVLSIFPTGTKDGANKVFALADAVATGTEIEVFLEGIRLGESLTNPPGAVQFYLDFAKSPGEIILGTAPQALDELVTNYEKVAAASTIITETPVASSTPGLYFLALEPEGSVAVFADGLRLSPAFVAVAGQDVTVSLGGLIPTTVQVAYVPKIDGAGESYIIQHSKDPGTTPLSTDTDIPAIPIRFHTALVEYAVGHLLLIGGDEDDVGDGEAAGPVIKALSSYASALRGMGGEVRGAAVGGQTKGVGNESW